jgi:hypothetical protein
MDYMIGIRYFSVHENMTLGGRGNVILDQNNTGNLLNGVISGTYTVQTQSNLLGLQFGGDITFRDCTWNWSIRYKLGPLMNMGHADSEVRTYTSPLDIGRDASWKDSKTEVAGFAQVGVVGNYKFSPRFSVQAGYDWAWIVGLSLAPEQAATPGHLNTSGVLFFQGLSLGCNYVF